MDRDKRRELLNGANGWRQEAAQTPETGGYKGDEQAQRLKTAMEAGVPTDAVPPQSAPELPDRAFMDTLDVMQAYGDAYARYSGSVAGVGSIGRDEIAEATAILQRYKQGKANLERRIVENEEYFRLLHNTRERREKAGKDGKGLRNTAWLFSAITNKVADFQDNYPAATVLPREPGDETAAKTLTAVIPAILDANNYRDLYRHTNIDKIKHGCGVQHIYWDSKKRNGLGDVAIRRVDPLNIFWEPGIEDVQQSANLFTVELLDNDALAAQYPEIPGLREQLTTPSIDVTRYVYNDAVDVSNKSYVVNWYYKRQRGPRAVLHYCRYVNDVVLFASENDRRYAEGWYKHGRYPFEFFVMYPEVGTPFGFGEIDIARDAQEDIDELNAAILRNVKQAARRRYFSSNGGNINENEFSDPDRDIVHVQGAIDEVSIKEIAMTPINAAALQWYANKIDELKETTGNRDVTQGGSAGTSTASGIAQLAENGNKVSRDLISASYESFKRVCELVIELIRQFYDVPRTIRITGEDGSTRFEMVSNEGMVSREEPGAFGVAAYQTAEPVFDLTVKAYKNNPYSRQQANQDALNMYNMEFFNPARGVEALACLELLEMDNIDKVRQVISRNYDAYVAAQQQAALDMMRMGAAPGAGNAEAEPPESGGRQAPQMQNKTNTVAEKAGAMARAGTQPR